MAIDGGGGGGGPVGFANSFTGSAQAIEIIGDHAYAYNALSANTVSAAAMSFTTGNYYFVGTLQINMPFNYSDPSDNIGYLEAKLNGSVVSLLTVGNVPPDSTDSVYQDLIIPPYTEVEINIKANSTVSSRLTTVTLTGRIYR